MASYLIWNFLTQILSHCGNSSLFKLKIQSEPILDNYYSFYDSSHQYFYFNCMQFQSFYLNSYLLLNLNFMSLVASFIAFWLVYVEKHFHYSDSLVKIIFHHHRFLKQQLMIFEVSLLLVLAIFVSLCLDFYFYFYYPFSQPKQSIKLLEQLNFQSLNALVSLN